MRKKDINTFGKKNLIVNYLLCFSIIFIFSIFCFQDTKELIPGIGFWFDTVLLNLSLSFITGYIVWFFTFILPIYKNEKEKINRYHKILEINLGELIYYLKINMGKNPKNDIAKLEVKDLSNLFKNSYPITYELVKGKELLENITTGKSYFKIDTEKISSSFKVHTKKPFEFLKDEYIKILENLKLMIFSENFTYNEELFNILRNFYLLIDKQLYVFSLLEENFYKTEQRDFFVGELNKGKDLDYMKIMLMLLVGTIEFEKSYKNEIKNILG